MFILFIFYLIVWICPSRSSARLNLLFIFIWSLEFVINFYLIDWILNIIWYSFMLTCLVESALHAYLLDWIWSSCLSDLLRHRGVVSGGVVVLIVGSGPFRPFFASDVGLSHSSLSWLNKWINSSMLLRGDAYLILNGFPFDFAMCVHVHSQNTEPSVRKWETNSICRSVICRCSIPFRFYCSNGNWKSAI